MFCLVEGLGYNVCNIVLDNDVVQFDDALLVVVSDHVVSEINLFRSLVGDQLVVHKHNPLPGLSMYICIGMSTCINPLINY